MVIMNPSFSNDATYTKNYRKTQKVNNQNPLSANLTAENVGISLRGETMVDHEVTSENLSQAGLEIENSQSSNGI